MNTKLAKKEIDKSILKLVKKYGCILLAKQFDDETFIKDCKKSGHKLYHLEFDYHLELNY